MAQVVRMDGDRADPPPFSASQPPSSPPNQDGFPGTKYSSRIHLETSKSRDARNPRPVASLPLQRKNLNSDTTFPRPDPWGDKLC